MSLNSISYNTLRSFAAAARHLSFTAAGKELFVTQAAVSHQVKALELQIGFPLFRRTTRGLVLTDEGQTLAPVVSESLGRIEDTLAMVQRQGPAQVLTISVIGTFAAGFLIERLNDFRTNCPMVDLRLLTNNNKVDMWSESLDYAIRFGEGAWHGVHAEPIMSAPIAPLCIPDIARQLMSLEDLAKFRLLRSYRVMDWPNWLKRAGVNQIQANGPIFDTSATMVQAALLSEGIALVPTAMFHRELSSGQLVQPFDLQLDAGSYWLTRLVSKQETPAMKQFKNWLRAAVPAVTQI
jgi:LysR family transcriptional regulator, regulator of gene expression of beta-lactamase